MPRRRLVGGGNNEAISVAGTKKRVDEVTAPRTVHEISERALNCGLTLPGE